MQAIFNSRDAPRHASPGHPLMVRSGVRVIPSFGMLTPSGESANRASPQSLRALVLAYEKRVIDTSHKKASERQVLGRSLTILLKDNIMRLRVPDSLHRSHEDVHEPFLFVLLRGAGKLIELENRTIGLEHPSHEPLPLQV